MATRLIVRVATESPEASPVGVPDLPGRHSEGWPRRSRDLLRPVYAAIAAGVEPPAPGELAPDPTLEEGAREIAFVDAVLASAREGRWTALSWTAPSGTALSV